MLLVGSGLGAMILNLFGEWNSLLTILLIAVTLDYFTGMIASGIEGKLSSKFGLRGIGRKVLIFSLVKIGRAHV